MGILHSYCPQGPYIDNRRYKLYSLIMPVYRNITDHDLTIPNVGVVKAKETIETDKILENANLKEEGLSTNPQEKVQEKQEGEE